MNINRDIGIGVEHGVWELLLRIYIVTTPVNITVQSGWITRESRTDTRHLDKKPSDVKKTNFHHLPTSANPPKPLYTSKLLPPSSKDIRKHAHTVKRLI